MDRVFMNCYIELFQKVENGEFGDAMQDTSSLDMKKFITTKYANEVSRSLKASNFDVAKNLAMNYLDFQEWFEKNYE